MAGLSRREFLALAPACAAAADRPLDRRAIVTRHNLVLHGTDPGSPLSVGNGALAFTVDFSGLQTFSALYERTIPLCTQSQWGWHSFPMPEDLRGQQLRLEMFDTYGRQVGYPTSAKGQERLFNWLRENPHRLNLARIGLLVDGMRPSPDSVTSAQQKLELWSGIIKSQFKLLDSEVTVLTCCHPDQDTLAISVRSPLIASARLTVEIEFPYGSTAVNASDWSSPARHQTRIARQDRQSLELDRELDADRYSVRLAWSGEAAARMADVHRIELTAKESTLDVVCQFAARRIVAPPSTAEATRVASSGHWSRFWSSGAAIDLSGSPDPRSQELERRIVLSQYLTAIQCAGTMPPQETGLTCNSWFGKFHLEMHWWHAAHFALWARAPLLERSLGWYRSILPSARAWARQQGYAGARWPKMVGPDGRDSPSPIGPLLIWQQPHLIHMAELCYRANANPDTLARYRDVVFDTAEFLASSAVDRDGRYVLGPPLIPAQENHPPRETWNPTFELAYWSQALETAQSWRKRLGLARNEKWDDVRARLSKLPARDGVYLAHENCPQTFTERNRDHPSMLAAFGMLRGIGVDRETMRRTLQKVFKEWRWSDTWGWDYPMTAMTAARLGEPGLAIDALFLESPKNTWLKNGHNPQRAGLPLYLPANGGLLAAIAMMAGGWNGQPPGDAPGFPKNWNVRSENFQPLL
jgi:hypothetical protein